MPCEAARKGFALHLLRARVRTPRPARTAKRLMLVCGARPGATPVGPKKKKLRGKGSSLPSVASCSG